MVSPGSYLRQQDSARIFSVLAEWMSLEIPHQLTWLLGTFFKDFLIAMSGINAPDPTEHFLLADGEKKYVNHGPLFQTLQPLSR